MQGTKALIKKACFTVKCQLLSPTTTSPVFFVFPLSRYLSISSVSSVPYLCLSLLLSLRFSFCIRCKKVTPRTPTHPLTLSKQLMLETTEREQKGRRKTNKGNGNIHSSKPKEKEGRRNLTIRGFFIITSPHPRLHLYLSPPVIVEGLYHT